eukprot:scaffold85282_cov16-Prasinocladus_malaysianus.AAC.1
MAREGVDCEPGNCQSLGSAKPCAKANRPKQSGRKFKRHHFTAKKKVATRRLPPGPAFADASCANVLEIEPGGKGLIRALIILATK